mgnify:CR=1 FL=1
MNAGPSFEVFFASGYLLPHTWQAWVLIHERIREELRRGQTAHAALDAETVASLFPSEEPVATVYLTTEAEIDRFVTAMLAIRRDLSKITDVKVVS